jgi:predicted phosphodiesterase
MKCDGLFTIRKFYISFQKFNQPITISASGDWHYDTKGHTKEKFIEYLKKSSDKGAWLLGLGDYLDLMSSSERLGYNKSEYHETTQITFDRVVEASVEELARLIKKYFGTRIIGLVGGNHYFNLSYNITSDQLLCQKLKCDYLGTNSLFRLIFKYHKSNYSADLVFCVHHGLTGKTPSSSIGRLKEMANNFDADVILMGHNHDRQLDYVNRLGISNQDKLYDRKILLARTGSFLKSYIPNQKSYGVDAGYPPGDIGGVFINITPVRKHIKCKANNQDDDIRFLNIEATI